MSPSRASLATALQNEGDDLLDIAFRHKDAAGTERSLRGRWSYRASATFAIGTALALWTVVAAVVYWLLP